jgi:multidrug resistance efflux pump
METQLHHLQEGGKASITFIGRNNQPFEGLIESIAWGIFDANGSTVELLPQVSQTIDWVLLPNRFPVRIKVTGTPPIPLRIGQTVSVSTSGTH